MSARTWAPWATGTGTALLTVSLGVAINQVHPNNFDRAGLIWLVSALIIAAVSAAATYLLSPSAPQAPAPRLWRSLTGPDGRPRRLSELTARDLGAHPCRFAADAENPYIERDTDPSLAQAIADPEQELIIVSGPRLSGATRTLARAAQQRLADHVVIGFHDDPSITVQEMVTTAAAGYLTADQPAVLWLDGLSPTRYTELATLDPVALPTGVRILATLDSADLDGYRIPQSVRDHIDSYATTVELSTLSSTERDHLRSEPAYKALASVLDEGDDLLLGHLMVSWDRMRAGLTPATGEEATDRIALLRAVTDWARISPPRRLNGDILPHLYRAYRNELTGQTSTPDRSQTRYKRALAWATTPHANRPLLVDERTNGSGTYFTAHPLLTVIANEQEEPVSWPVSDQMWTYANLFILDVPREVVLFLSRLLAAERKLLGTRKGTRALTCYHQAIMALRYFREGTNPATLARDHGIGRSTGYRYIDEATAVLADQAPELHHALHDAYGTIGDHVEPFTVARQDSTPRLLPGAPRLCLPNGHFSPGVRFAGFVPLQSCWDHLRAPIRSSRCTHMRSTFAITWQITSDSSKADFN